MSDREQLAQLSGKSLSRQQAEQELFNFISGLDDSDFRWIQDQANAMRETDEPSVGTGDW